MAGHKKVNSNVEVKKEVVEVKKEVVVEVKKGGKVPVVEAKVVPAKVVPVVVAPVVVEAKKGGKRTKAVPVVEPVVVPVVVPVVEVKKGGRKTKTVVEAKKETEPVVEQKTTPVKKGGKTKTTGDNKSEPVVSVKKGKAKKNESVEETEGDDKKHTRSFKVRLPGSDAFEGRFTGLTPYQAANKALSKYYRESNELQKEVTFSICESTRNSRKSTYTYIGGRHELTVPVTYTIADGRLITKNYKNVLKKVKKSEEASVSASN